MPEMHSRQPGFAYGACGLFTTNKKRMQKLIRNWRFTIFL